MKVSDKGLIELVCHEGIVPYPYLDSVGVWTYGIGHTASAGDPNPKTMPRGVATSLRACVELFRKDLAKYEAAVARAVKVPLKPHEFDAIVSWHYNTGAVASASWIKRLNAGDRAGAIEGIMDWNKPAEIIGRRTAERNLFRDGVYSNNGKALVYTADKNGKLGRATPQNVADLLWLVPAPEARVPKGGEIYPVEPVPTPQTAPAAPVLEPTRNDGKHEAPKSEGFWSRFLAAFRKRTAS